MGYVILRQSTRSRIFNPAAVNVDIRKHISNRVRELRAKRRLTQQASAEAADLDYKSIQRLEAKSPRFHPKVDTLEKVAKAFGISLSELLKRSELLIAPLLPSSLARPLRF